MAYKKKKMKSMTIDEAKKEVLKLVQQGVSFREISQIKFQIGDRIKKFSIGEISKIKNGVKGRENNSENIDNDTALLFKKFSKGKKPKELVIETRLKPDFVEQAYEKYLKLDNMRIIPAEFLYKVYEWIEMIKEDGCGDLDEDYKYLKDAVDYYLQLNFTYPCSRCRKLIRLDKEAWPDARQYLVSQGWHHNECG